MPDAALTRTGLTPLLSSGADTTDIYRLNLRQIAALIEASGVLGAQGLDAARPVAGTSLKLYKPTDVSGVLYYDNGTAWEAIGGSAATDPAAGVGGLRTLGAGSTQAAPGTLVGGLSDLQLLTQAGAI